MLCLAAHPAWGRVPLYRDAPRTPGALGGFMAGAQVALAGGAEAGWYNPAGLSRTLRTEIAASGDALAVQESPGNDSTSVATPAFVAAVWSFSDRRDAVRVSYGVHAGWSRLVDVTTHLEDDRLVSAAGIPTSVSAGIDLDSLFPEGIRRRESATGSARMRVFSPGFGVGVQPASWLRFGFGLRVEDVALATAGTATATYSADRRPDADVVLDGVTHTTWRLNGHLTRWAYVTGLQMELGPSVSVGLLQRWPSRTQGGNADVHLSRTSRLAVRQNGAQSTPDAFVLVDETDVPLELRTPGQLTLGVAFRFDTVAVEMDIRQIDAQSDYTVVPAQEAAPPSTTPYRLEPRQSGGVQALHYALGLALSANRNDTLLMGIAQAPTTVPGDDDTFRAVTVNTVTAGFHRAEGAGAWAAGVTYRFVDETGVAFPDAADGPTLSAPLGMTETALRLAGSMLF